MKLKCFRKLTNRFLLCFCRKPLVAFLSSKEKNEVLDLIVVAFNNPQLIAYQLDKIRRFVTGADYNYLVCDNSSDSKKSAEIFRFCRDNDVSYFRIPRFVYEDPSRSHGYALNWIYRYVISKRKNDFMLLDHDIFPVKPVDLSVYAKNYKLSGVVSHRNDLWYMWPGLSYYNYKYLSLYQIDFLPKKANKVNLDTGGGNCLTVYQNFPIACLFEVNREAVNFLTGEIATADTSVQEVVEYFDDRKWLHIVGGSGWFGDSHKNQDIFLFLDKLLSN